MKKIIFCSLLLVFSSGITYSQESNFNITNTNTNISDFYTGYSDGIVYAEKLFPFNTLLFSFLGGLLTPVASSAISSLNITSEIFFISLFSLSTINFLLTALTPLDFPKAENFIGKSEAYIEGFNKGFRSKIHFKKFLFAGLGTTAGCLTIYCIYYAIIKFIMSLA